MDNYADNYYILIPIPLLVVLITTVISYFCGLRIPSALGLGLFFSLITIIIIHPFHTNNDTGELTMEHGNFYVSVYIFVDILLIFGLFFYIVCKNKGHICCEKNINIDYSTNEGNGNDIDYSVVPSDLEDYRDNPDILVQTDGEFTDVDSNIESTVHPGLRDYNPNQFVGTPKTESIVIGTPKLVSKIDKEKKVSKSLPKFETKYKRPEKYDDGLLRENKSKSSSDDI